MRYYFRRKGVPATALPGKPGSPEFVLAWQAAAAKAPAPIGKRSLPGSINATVEAYYQDERFKALADGTRAAHRRVLEHVRTWPHPTLGEYGKVLLRDIEKGHVAVMLAGLKPFARNNWLKTLRGFFKFAVDTEVIKTDPSAEIDKTPRSEGGHFHTWTEDEVRRYEARFPVGSMARLALALMLYTGQRRSDAIRIGPQHFGVNVRGREYIRVQVQKTGMKKRDEELRIPVHPELRRIIDATNARGDLVFLVNAAGQPFSTPNSFGERMRKWCDQAGNPDCASHGLRKAMCRRLAEAGCSASQIQAITGHKNLAEVELYVKEANRHIMAEDAIDALIANGPETPVSNRRLRAV
jgi:integrase